MQLFRSTSAHRSGTVHLLAGAVLISFSGVFVKLAHVGPTTAGFYRTFLGGLLLAALVLARRERVWNGPRHLGLAAACGLIFALDLTCWHRCIHYVGPGLSTILGNFQVFFVALFSIAILKERPGWKLLVSIPLAMAGLFLIVGVDWGRFDHRYHLGVVLGLLTALCYASYLLVLRRLQSGPFVISPLVTIGVISLVTASIMGAEVAVLGEGFRIPDFRTGLALAAYGVCGQVLGWVLITKGLRNTQASRAGLILLLQPALAFVWDILLFYRPTLPREVAGALLACGAIYLGAISRNSTLKPVAGTPSQTAEPIHR